MTNAVVEQRAQKRLVIPKAPVLALAGQRLWCLTLDGEIKQVSDAEARAICQGVMPIICNGPQLAARLKVERFPAYDVLELFAFIHPGRFCVPTPRGIAKALGLMEPEAPEDQCLALRDGIRHLLADLAAPGREEKSDPAGIAAVMGRMGSDQSQDFNSGWPWTPVVLAALGRDVDPPSRGEMRAAVKIWDKLPEWAQAAPEPPASHIGIDAREVEERLLKLTKRPSVEDRPQQRDYSAALARAFSPCHDENQTHVVLAEAGTGTGKTLGYLAPATIWAEKNGGPVWVSTYTRNLQRQVDGELDKLYDDPVTKARKVVTRKGRENYICLLNLEDAAASQGVAVNDLSAMALGLMTRWAAVTSDGDLMGKEFPGWLTGLMGWTRFAAFADKRGECIYSACPHFNKCFVEKSIRKSKRADIVIANHALVMHQTASSGPDDVLPGRYIFDEGHHLFEAADSAFDAQLNGQWTSDLRRWLLGTETGQKTRARGLKRRIEDIVAGDDVAVALVEEIMEAAKALPGPQWRQRMAENAPKGAAEEFLLICRQQVYARTKEHGGYYSLETQTLPPVPGLLEAAQKLENRLKDLQRPMNALIASLKQKLEDEAETLDTAQRERIHFIRNSLYRRAAHEIGGWIAMLIALRTPVQDNGSPEFVDWLEVTRADGKDYDAGYYRYYVDPAKVFAEVLKPHAHGVVVTSATLRDISLDDHEGWKSPKARTGSAVLGTPEEPKLFHVPSPFNYAAQTRVLVVGDVKKENPGEAAAAFRELFKASGGGALGIFTAVQRLRAVYDKIAEPLAESNLHLYAQHVDPLDTGTLIDIFREEENACLLGTDATRDGIDVPGRSLRLVVYDRVPWPRPTILHKARRNHFGKDLDDMLTRFKIKQAYGRLIRRSDDKGVFVMLDGALPTRLLSAFPDGVEVERIGLKEAIERTREFLREESKG
ncbi:MAG TPA: ATP-dependent DNA helicase [Patescibacteria group bacterium]|nr:ATP-dependent DNA helicase [Patescibacteria group bacterium]